MSVQTLKDKAVKRMGTGMKAIVKEKVLQIIEKAYAEGIYVLITDGYRSYAEQDALYAQGRTKPGQIVTNAKGGQSNHNFGIAVDFCLTNKEGTTASWTINSDWKRVVAIAKSLGFEWGGDWKSFKDNPHLEYTGKVTETKETTIKTSSSDNAAIVPYPGKVIQKGSKGKDVARIQRAVGVKVDEDFGPATEKAVKAYQKRKGLDVDGKVGKYTWNMMF